MPETSDAVVGAMDSFAALSGPASRYELKDTKARNRAMPTLKRYTTRGMRTE